MLQNKSKPSLNRTFKSSDVRGVCRASGKLYLLTVHCRLRPKTSEDVDFGMERL